MNTECKRGLSYGRGQKLTPPENRILYDHFYNDKSYQNYMIFIKKSTCGAWMCRPYGRGQKLTPPENRILDDHFYNNKLHENQIKHDENQSI